MQRVTILILLFVTTISYGQDLSFRQVDTTTYNQYLREEWKELITTGNEALDQGFDYYYLRMRIAYAWFSMGRYRKAIGAYKEALVHNSSDPYANEYLYYSYKYSGQRLNALKQEEALTSLQLKAMGINPESGFADFGIWNSWLATNADVQVNDLLEETGGLADGVQKASLKLNYLNFNLSHRLGRSVIIHHSGRYLYKNEFSYVVSGGIPYLSEYQPVSQYEYRAGMDIRLAEGLIITPGFHFLQASVPIYTSTSYGPGSGMNRIPVTYLKQTNRALTLNIQKQTTYADIGLTWANNNFNLVSTNQVGMHAAFYPLANLDLYLVTDGYAQFHQFNTEQETGFILRLLAGVKVRRNIWLELTGSIGEQFNFYDIRSGTAFNSLESITKSAGANILIPLYKSNAQIFIGYTYREMQSGFHAYDNMLNPYNLQLFNAQMISGGIKWTR